MADEPKTGIGGKVSVRGVEIPHVRNWKLSQSCDIPTYASSSTNGREKTGLGNIKSEDVTFEVYLPDGDMELPFRLGMLCNFIGYSDASVTTSMVIRIASIEVGVDIEGATFTGATVTAKGHSSPVYSATNPTPTTTPTPSD
jgi:hypothetical protein